MTVTPRGQGPAAVDDHDLLIEIKTMLGVLVTRSDQQATEIASLKETSRLHGERLVALESAGAERMRLPNVVPWMSMVAAVALAAAAIWLK